MDDRDNHSAGLGLALLFSAPILLMAFGNAMTTDMDATVTRPEYTAYSNLFSPYEAIDTDRGRLALSSRFDAALEKGKRYRFTLEDMALGPILIGVKGSVKSFAPLP